MESSESVLTLYWNIMSQPSRSVKALLKAGKIPHETESIDIMNKVQKKEEFTAINPRQMVPFLKVGDWTILK